jgi:hypothetical protein
MLSSQIYRNRKLSRAKGGENGNLLLNRYEVSGLHDEKALKMRAGSVAQWQNVWLMWKARGLIPSIENQKLKNICGDPAHNEYH